MNFRIALLFLLLGGLFLQSCKKDTDVQPDTSTEKAYFECQINGVGYAALDFQAYAADFDTHINIYGIISDNLQDVIYIALPKGTTPGTYTLNEDIYAVATINGQAYASYWGDGSGTVTVKEFDGTRFQGSFSIKLPNAQNTDEVLEITQGKYDVNIRL